MPTANCWTPRARASGDDAGAAAALEAMQTARRWPILLEMRKAGGWTSVVLRLTDEMKAGSLKRTHYVSALGCETGTSG